MIAFAVAVLLAGSLAGCGKTASSGAGTAGKGSGIELTNVSYDPTRELYASYNQVYEKHYKGKTE